MTAYNKVFETWRGRRLSKNVFWICENSGCVEYIKIITGIWNKPFFDDGYLWTKVKEKKHLTNEKNVVS